MGVTGMGLNVTGMSLKFAGTPCNSSGMPFEFALTKGDDNGILLNHARRGTRFWKERCKLVEKT